MHPSCSNTTDKKYYDSPKTKPLFIQTYFSQHTLLLQSKCKIQHPSTHDTMMHCVSQYLVDMIVHELWYNFCLWLKQDVHALSSWCPDVIIFFLRHLDAYNEMVVSSYLNGRDTDVCSLCSRVARFSQQNPPNCYSKLAQK